MSSVRPPTAPARADPRHYTPCHLPPELLGGEPSEPSAAKHWGQVGLLEMRFAPVGGLTRLVEHFQQVPTQIVRPLHLDPHRPDMAFVHLVHTGGGILQGDRYRLDLTCDAGAAVHLTTQAATKIYRMERDYATQMLCLTALDDAVIEYLPEPLIPFRGSRFYQQLRMTVAESATVIVGETLLPGRVAGGERHAYHFFGSRTEATRPDGRLIFLDTLRLAPRAHRLDSPARLGAYDVSASLTIVSRRRQPGELVACLRAALVPTSPVLAGASELPFGGGAIARFLGPTSAVVREAMQAAWNAARRLLLDAPAPVLLSSEDQQAPR